MSAHHHHRATQAKKITYVGAFINFLQGIIKLIGGYWFNSHALIADGFHSFSDLLTDFLVVFGAHFGSQHADAEHPYGHARIETATTLLLSLLLIAAGVSIGWHSFETWQSNALEKPDIFALVIACGSVLVNELIFYFTLKIGDTIESDLVKANAWHHRADSASALMVSLGILGGVLGYSYLDALAAIIVALLIIKMGLQYTYQSIHELIDSAVDPEQIKAIQDIILATTGVQKIHQLRTRRMGGRVFVDVHILVHSYISVSEGHYIAQKVHRSLIKSLPKVQDVTVHVDPEDDEIYAPSVHLPDRLILERTLFKPLQQQFSSIQTWNLHYLNGKLVVDLFIKINHPQLETILGPIQKHFSAHTYIETIRIFLIAHELDLPFQPSS